MAIKYFDINRLVNIGFGDYVCFDDIIGVRCSGHSKRMVDRVYVAGGHEFQIDMPMADFEDEVERAIKQTMSDQNENLNDFQNELKTKLEEAKQERLFHKTDKISDAN